MASVGTQQSSRFGASAGWFAQECTQRGFSAPQARLSNDSYIEAFLQGILLFGPAAFLLIATPFRIFQLYRAKLVTLPNCRGLVKLVSEKGKFDLYNAVINSCGDFIIHCLRLAADLHYHGDSQDEQHHVLGVSTAPTSCLCGALCAVLF